MIRRLSPQIRNVYHNIIMDQLSRDFIEEVTDDDRNIGHYLPHRAVKKESSTTPIRIVYNASLSTAGNPSLNDCLETGPTLLNDLGSILIRFRLHKFGLSADIEKAFLQVGLHDDDREYTKFLWLTDPKNPESELKTYRFKVILFGVVSSPFILNATVRFHLNNYNNHVSRDLVKNIYVDNAISGCESESDLMKYYTNINSIMKNGGFKLQSYASNSSLLKAKADSDNLSDEKTIVSALGLQWDTVNDTLSFKNKQAFANPDLITKREIVKAVSSLYDPLGYVSPVHIKSKMFVQQLWTEGYEWDETLPERVVESWISLITELREISEIRVDRRYSKSEAKSEAKYELHTFCDASQLAYGACVYLKRGDQTVLVMSKSRVAPVKKHTIPQLELMAALIGAKLTDYVRNSLITEIVITKCVLWSDSQIVLHWINSEKKLPVFVANRVRQIKSVTTIGRYKYCPTSDNPADMLSRGISCEQITRCTLWWNGPSWLSNGNYPTCDTIDRAVLLITEMDEDKQPDEKICENNEVGMCNVIDQNDFTSLTRLLRVTALVRRFIKKLRRENHESDEITANEIAECEDLWNKGVQSSYFNDVKVSLEHKSKKRPSLVKKLRLFLEDDIIRVGGRLHNAPIGYDAKFPILLPHCRYSELIVLDSHNKVKHLGTESTITVVRQKYWITRVRQVARKLLRKCVICKYITGKPYSLPNCAPLQSSRLKEAPPFTVCGLDFTGALHLRSKSGEESLAYICLFTCANTRAIHLEVVTDMTTSTFLHALRRMAARRSLPQKIISDNQSTFIASNNAIKKIYESIETRKYFSLHRSEWVMITRRAPWFGGFYERLVGITKTAIKKVLGRARISLLELITIVSETEQAVNNRPISYCSSDVDDPEPLTPSHFLHGRVLTSLPHLFVSYDELTDPTLGNMPSEFEKRSVRIGSLKQHLWKRWAEEYVTALRERHIQFKSRGLTGNTIRKGDVVLVHDDNHNSRLKWRLALVEELVPGNDGLVRTAKIKISNGRTNRPISKLYPLEVRAADPSNTCKPDSNVNSAPVTRHSTRKAAAEARNNISRWANVLSDTCSS
ncbi:uncharacterized protein LOC141910505 [Tubulanus polymorphus]|uniref:uncharacterized protein LOC141910505 n=1 Tax=Tubulanus polymorphus TaxID=672921 RepID=UPI003DA213A5